jgi:ubiquinone/menaquinone biosynthesis C-methylase UbiE
MSIKKEFLRFYWMMQKLIIPDLKYSQEIYEKTLFENVISSGNWLDIGCGHHILPIWREISERSLISKVNKVIGFDYDFESLKKHRSIKLRVRGDIVSLPFNDNIFDLVTANMVVEHLKEPQKQLIEIYRILKPGGLFIFHTPNLFGYSTFPNKFITGRVRKRLIYFLQERAEDDVFETHYKMNTICDIETLVNKTKFEIINIETIVSSAQFFMIPFLVLPELILLKILMLRPFKKLRTNIIGILKK